MNLERGSTSCRWLRMSSFSSGSTGFARSYGAARYRPSLGFCQTSTRLPGIVIRSCTHPTTMRSPDFSVYVDCYGITGDISTGKGRNLCIHNIDSPAGESSGAPLAPCRCVSFPPTSIGSGRVLHRRLQMPRMRRLRHTGHLDGMPCRVRPPVLRAKTDRREIPLHVSARILRVAYGSGTPDRRIVVSLFDT